jgi:subtilisin-like proprotein convertase family protein
VKDITMLSNRFSLVYWKSGLSTHHARSLAMKLALGALATTLAVGAAVPTFAGESQHERKSSHHGQRPARVVHAAGKRHHGKSKTVTRSFASDDFIAISDGTADPYPSTIAVTSFKKAKATDVNLTLRGFSHEFPKDVDVLLVAPGGRNAVVMAEVGAPPVGPAEVTGLTLSLDDEADDVLPAQEQLRSGAFRPFSRVDPTVFDFPLPAPRPSGDVALSGFDGINPNGEWQLFILDDTIFETGSLTDGWTLEITAKAKGKKKR